MMLDTCLTGVDAAASSTPAATSSKSSAPACRDQAAALGPAPSPSKAGQSGEVWGGGWYVACLMTRAL